MTLYSRVVSMLFSIKTPINPIFPPFLLGSGFVLLWLQAEDVLLGLTVLDVSRLEDCKSKWKPLEGVGLRWEIEE